MSECRGLPHSLPSITHKSESILFESIMTLYHSSGSESNSHSRLSLHLNEHCTSNRMEDLLMNIFLKQVFSLNDNPMINPKSELEWIVSGLRISALRQVLPPHAPHRCQRQGWKPCGSRPRVWEFQQLDPSASALPQGTWRELLSQVWYQSKNVNLFSMK